MLFNDPVQAIGDLGGVRAGLFAGVCAASVAVAHFAARYVDAARAAHGDLHGVDGGGRADPASVAGGRGLPGASDAGGRPPGVGLPDLAPLPFSADQQPDPKGAGNSKLLSRQSTETLKEHLMDPKTLFTDVVAFVEHAAPGLEQTLVNDAKSALTAAEAAFTPVLETAADAAVTAVLAHIPNGLVDDAASIALVNGVIEKLAKLLPAMTPAANGEPAS